ncbi:chemotaxis protein CheW [Halodesulfurarchaeum sp.]
MKGQILNVLKFSLGDGRYCIDISHVEEIVDANEEITPDPNADDHIVGVVDLRGETTTIVDPKSVTRSRCVRHRSGDHRALHHRRDRPPDR